MARSFDHIFNVEYAEAQRRTPQLPHRWQSQPSNTTALTRGLLAKVVERLPTHTLPGLPALPMPHHNPHKTSGIPSLCDSVHRQVVSHLSTESFKLGLTSETGSHRKTTSG